MPASARVVEDGGIGIQQTQTTNSKKHVITHNDISDYSHVGPCVKMLSKLN